MLARVLEALSRAVHAEDPRAGDLGESDAAVSNAASDVDDRDCAQPVAELGPVYLDDPAPEDVGAPMANELRAIMCHAWNQALTFVVDDRLDPGQL